VLAVAMTTVCVSLGLWHPAEASPFRYSDFDLRLRRPPPFRAVELHRPESTRV